MAGRSRFYTTGVIGRGSVIDGTTRSGQHSVGGSLLRNVVGAVKAKGKKVAHGLHHHHHHHHGGDEDRSHREMGERRESMRGPTTDTSTRFQKLVTNLRNCIDEMSPESDVSDADLERWSCLIYESMSAPSRTFHSVQHVFDISAGSEDPVEIVSAFFHDVVYYHVDGGLSGAQEEVLGGIIREEETGGENGSEKKKTVYLREIDRESDKAMSLVMSVFGFEGGQELNPFLGLNEFLSAALACRCLEGAVDLAHIAEIAACIEMTIPFRKPKDGKDCTQLLFERLQSTRDSFDLNLPDDRLVTATQRAVAMANRDVGNFSTDDPAHFLSNTWNLLPESNITLRHTLVFRISNFTLALKKMEGFFSFLDPSVIYVSFRGSPSDKTIHDMTERARQNLDVALKYMRCKLLSISVLAALAELTGGDAPVAMFLGDLPEPGYVSPSIEDFILAPPFDETSVVMAAKEKERQKKDRDSSGRSKNGERNSKEGEGGGEEKCPQSKSPTEVSVIDKKVYNLLRCGREAESSFDLKHSPLAAYLYGLMGDAGLEASLEYVVHPMTKEGARKVLGSVPKDAVRKIANACAGIALTRGEKLREIAKEYAD